MGVGHVTMPQLHGPMGLRVLQWCHPVLACIKRASYCTWMIWCTKSGFRPAQQEHHDQETEEEQIPPDPDIPVEPIPQITETPETTTQIYLNNLIDDNNDEYNELKDEYVDLLGKVKA